MAIPFSLPSDDATLEQYRIIHQLLLDLTAVLRTLLARNPEWARPEADTTTNSTNITFNLSPLSGSQFMSSSNFNPIGPQFGLPLSPPNSQPGSPSPFFTVPGSSGSAFVLPDVVSSAARTLECLTHPQMPITTAPLTMQPQMAYAEERLRKRKRTKTCKKKRIHNLDSGSCINHCCKKQFRKMPKITYNLESFCSDDSTPVVSSSDDVMMSERSLRECSSHHCQNHHNVQSQHLHQNHRHHHHHRRRHHQNNNNNNNNHHHHRYHHHHHDQHPNPGGRVTMCPAADFPTNCAVASERYCIQASSSNADSKIPICMHVGEELRKIVECFRSPIKMQGDGVSNAKSSYVVSQFGRTMFTAALLVIGWKLLLKQN